jgi:hypothetical protein
MILDNLAVPDSDIPLASGGEVFIVGNEHECHSGIFLQTK